MTEVYACLFLVRGCEPVRCIRGCSLPHASVHVSVEQARASAVHSSFLACMWQQIGRAGCGVFFSPITVHIGSHLPPIESQQIG